MKQNSAESRTMSLKYASGARCLRILGHPVRLSLLKMLFEREWSVNEMARELEISQ